ncbi:MAG: response regulator transcription factor, partial [Eggerthellaceae bacterium]|nr:response regulator transcription factor [Eggerthellaceae bacterium]
AIPILFITARDDLASKQRGFQAGIDDYMVKPVNMEELVLRVGALLRRAKISSEKRLVIGNMAMDADEMGVTVDGEEIPVTVREFNILYKLLSYPKKAFSRQQLMDEFWDINSETTLRAVDVYITRLRDKLSGCTGFRIVTVHGLGYKAVLQ